MVNEDLITLLLFIRLMNWEYDSVPGQRQHIINLGTGRDTHEYCDARVKAKIFDYNGFKHYSLVFTGRPLVMGVSVAFQNHVLHFITS